MVRPRPQARRATWARVIHGSLLRQRKCLDGQPTAADRGFSAGLPSFGGPRLQQVRQSRLAEALGPHPVRHRVDDLGAVLSGIRGYPVRPFAERPADDVDDGARDGGGVGVGRLERGHALPDLIRKAPVGALVVQRSALDVSGFARVGEVVGALGERAGRDDAGLDAPAGQLAGVGHGERILRGLGREVRPQPGRDAAPGAGRGDPDRPSPPAPLRRVLGHRERRSCGGGRRPHAVRSRMRHPSRPMSRRVRASS